MRDRAIEIDMHIEIWSLYRKPEQGFEGLAMLGEDLMEFGGIVWPEIRFDSGYLRSYILGVFISLD